MVSGCEVRAVPSTDGILRWKDIEPAIRPARAPTALPPLVEIENTHNMAGGAVYPMDVVEEISANVHARGIKVHMDGARIFNAACHLNRPVRDLAAPADSVMFCLSKGLGAPVGSMLVGDGRGAISARGVIGNVWAVACARQACWRPLVRSPSKKCRTAWARITPERAIPRFGELAKLPGIQIDPAQVQTNIVIFDISATGYPYN